MSLPLSGLDMSAFSINGIDLYAILKLAKLKAENDQANAAGMGSRLPYYLNVKQDQELAFTCFQYDADDIPCTNLSVSAYTIGGDDFLGNLRSGSLNIRSLTKERSSLANAYKVPNLNGTDFDISCDLLVANQAEWLNTLLSGTVDQFDAIISLTFGVQTFTAPMTAKMAELSAERGEMQMERVQFTPKGAITSPSDGTATLLGIMLVGAAAVSLSMTTGGGESGTGDGGNTYETDGGVLCALTQLNTNFADAQVIEQSGILKVQGVAGGLTVS